MMRAILSSPLCIGFSVVAMPAPLAERRPDFHFVIPAQAGIQEMHRRQWQRPWIPACAGMTLRRIRTPG